VSLQWLKIVVTFVLAGSPLVANGQLEVAAGHGHGSCAVLVACGISFAVVLGREFGSCRLASCW
jgi:hypothetical protein